jgi:hypothetical protein
MEWVHNFVSERKTKTKRELTKVLRSKEAFATVASTFPSGSPFAKI